MEFKRQRESIFNSRQSSTIVRTEMRHKPGLQYDKIAGVRFVLLMLKLVAVWPWKYDHKNRFAMRNQRLCCLIIHIPTTLLFSLLVCVEAFTSDDLNQAGNILHMALSLTAYIVKLLNLILLSKEAGLFMYELQHNKIYDLLTTQEADVWSEYQKSFSIVVFIYTCGSVLSGVSAFVGVLFSDEYLLAFPYWLPFEWRNADHYWYAYSYNLVSMLICCLTDLNLDLLGPYMIFHISLLYKILNIRYSNLQHLEEKQALLELNRLFILHSNIKRMTRECEKIISNYVLCQIVFSALIICFCGYRLQNISILTELGQFFSMLQFMTIMILEIYLPCHYANKITIYSANLLDNIYDCNWWKFSTANRKYICLYMEFFKRPEKIRAGNFFEIGLPIFSTVMNNAYKFFALLLNVSK